jgi:hypothetical protein
MAHVRDINGSKRQEKSVRMQVAKGPSSVCTDSDRMVGYARHVVTSTLRESRRDSLSSTFAGR